MIERFFQVQFYFIDCFNFLFFFLSV